METLLNKNWRKITHSAISFSDRTIRLWSVKDFNERDHKLVLFDLMIIRHSAIVRCVNTSARTFVFFFIDIFVETWNGIMRRKSISHKMQGIWYMRIIYVIAFLFILITNIMWIYCQNARSQLI